MNIDPKVLDAAADITTAPDILREYFDTAWKMYNGRSLVHMPFRDDGKHSHQFYASSIMHVLAQNPNTPPDILRRLFEFGYVEDIFYSNSVFSLMLLENPDMLREWLYSASFNPEWADKVFTSEIENAIIDKGNTRLWHQQIFGNHVSSTLR